VRACSYVDSNKLFYFFSIGGHVLSGWLPVYDTMHGMRGEVSVIVKVELFSDVNKFRQSSCGVQFFSSKQFFLCTCSKEIDLI